MRKLLVFLLVVVVPFFAQGQIKKCRFAGTCNTDPPSWQQNGGYVYLVVGYSDCQNNDRTVGVRCYADAPTTKMKVCPKTNLFAQKVTPANSFLGKAVEMYTY
jgi:hypothetical protein